MMSLVRIAGLTSLLLLSFVVCEAAELSDFYDCMTNDDCESMDVCCSYTPALGKRHLKGRQLPPDWDGMVHYCLPWKNENATWCSLNLQFSHESKYYEGLCPCAPGLKCAPTTELDETSYPRDRYGKCVAADY